MHFNKLNLSFILRFYNNQFNLKIIPNYFNYVKLVNVTTYMLQFYINIRYKNYINK